ncbi:LTA synthase family protein [Wukongibacter baidiensis]
MSDIKTLKSDEIDHSRSNNIQPNIVVIMSEAFWDPSVMKEVKFSSPPTPNINKLKPTSIYGYLESPTFGGGTANTEFELLTGNSIHFFNSGYMVYPNEIKEPIIALPSILKNQGYTCKAIHPFKNWYWNRREVYKHMGFDEYISEEYLVDPIYKGFFISDEYVTDLIIKELEASNDPTFIFAVTMQNHGPYDDNRYNGHTKDIDISAKVSSESLQILQTYTQGVYDADKALGKLIDYCNGLSKPTIVLFFGDHLPVLGKNYKVYRETDFIQKDSVNHDNTIKLTSVPFVLWSNYKTKSHDLGLLNTSFMGPYLLEYAGLKMPNYFKFLQSFSKQVPVISRPYAIDKEENIIESDDEKYIAYNNDYLLVQQNILYEDKVFEDNYSKWIVKENPKYNSGLNKISINDVTIQNNSIIIRGNNFYPKSLLLIDGKHYRYQYINHNEIHLRKRILKSGSKLEIKLFDSKNNLLAKSNTYIY